MSRGVPSKNSHGPSLRPHHPPNPTFHARCPTRNGEALDWLWGCRRTSAEQRRRAINSARLQPNRRRTEFFHEFQSFPGAPRNLPSPASPDAPSGEPSSRTTTAGTPQPSRSRRVCKIAHQVIRGSWVRCACGSHLRQRLMRRMRRRGPLTSNVDPCCCGGRSATIEYAQVWGDYDVRGRLRIHLADVMAPCRTSPPYQPSASPAPGICRSTAAEWYPRTITGAPPRPNRRRACLGGPRRRPRHGTVIHPPHAVTILPAPVPTRCPL